MFYAGYLCVITAIGEALINQAWSHTIEEDNEHGDIPPASTTENSRENNTKPAQLNTMIVVDWV